MFYSIFILENQEKEYAIKRNEYNVLDNEIKEVSHALLQKQMAYAKLEVVVQGKREELIKAKSEYESLSDQNIVKSSVVTINSKAPANAEDIANS